MTKCNPDRHYFVGEGGHHTTTLATTQPPFKRVVRRVWKGHCAVCMCRLKKTVITGYPEKGRTSKNTLVVEV